MILSAGVIDCASIMLNSWKTDSKLCSAGKWCPPAAGDASDLGSISHWWHNVSASGKAARTEPWPPVLPEQAGGLWREIVCSHVGNSAVQSWPRK